MAPTGIIIYKIGYFKHICFVLTFVDMTFNINKKSIDVFKKT